MPPFFTSAGADPAYEALRLGGHANAVAARQEFEPLWAAAAPFLDSDLPRNATMQFQQAFWEVYLAAALLAMGKRLISRDRRGEGGPDIFQADPDVFYEAIAVTPGTSADRVEEAEPLVPRPVPDDQVSLRLASGLAEKLAKYLRYRKSGLAPPGHPFVIAINAGGVPSAVLERSIPRIVRTVFPVGDEVLHLDPTTNKITGVSYEYRPWIAKKSGAHVPTSFFESEGIHGISAVLYSAVDPCNVPSELGADFVLVRNPRAVNPLPPRSLPRSREFWVEGDRLRGEQV